MTTDEGRELQERMNKARIARETGAQGSAERSYVERQPQQVIVTNVQMPFVSMVVFMVKWSLASIPAMLILFVIGALLLPVMLAIVGAHSH